MYINLVCALNHVPTLWDPMDCSSPGSSVYGILRAGILESVAIPFSRGWNPGLLHCRSILYRLSHQGSPCKSFLTAYFYCCCLVAKLCPTLQTHGLYSPPGSSVHGISRQEYWSGLPLPSPGNLPNLGIKPTSPVSLARQGDSLLLSHRGSPFFLYKYT